MQPLTILSFSFSRWSAGNVSREAERTTERGRERDGECESYQNFTFYRWIQTEYGFKLEEKAKNQKKKKLKKKSFKSNETTTLLVVYLTDQSIRMLH